MSTTQRLTEIEAQEKALADEKAKLLAASKDAWHSSKPLDIFHRELIFGCIKWG
jgi:hypothetical protein